eukprot:4835048-Amphidinium_carterae.1
MLSVRRVSDKNYSGKFGCIWGLGGKQQDKGCKKITKRLDKRLDYVSVFFSDRHFLKSPVRQVKAVGKYPSGAFALVMRLDA